MSLSAVQISANYCKDHFHSRLKIVSVIISYFLNIMSNPELTYSITDFLLGAVSS